MIQVQPYRGPIVFVGTAELMQTRLSRGEHGQEQGHVIVIPIDSYTRIFEIIVTVQVQALPWACLHDAGTGRLGFKSNERFDVVKVRIVGSHEVSDAKN